MDQEMECKSSAKIGASFLVVVLPQLQVGGAQ